jgi:hypothetical protein
MDDEPLVRAYLGHFFLSETSYRDYLPYVNDIYLKELFAETKIVNGLGEPEQWHSLLPPDKYQRLKDRVDLDFVPTNKRFFGPDDPVSLDLHVKNVDTLIVKVFEVNTRNFYRQFGREVNTDINLDGLIANYETTYKYTEPPLRRVQRHFDFPSLEARGVYVIDFIGSGKSSRVVVRKGRLYHLVRTTAAGHEFTILDEHNRLVKDASVWLSGREFVAGDDGTVVVPFTNDPREQSVVLCSGRFSSLASFRHESEAYQLLAGMHIDRESLLSQRKATVIIRPALRLNGLPVSLSLLERVQLTIKSTDHDGVSSTQTVKEFKLLANRASTHEFLTPARLSELTITLAAQVKNLSQDTEQDLSVSESFSLNQIDKTEKVEDLYFLAIAGQYYVDVLGRTGEPKADRPVQLSLKHREFTEDVRVVLKTDSAGRVALGTLPSIETVTATGPEGTSHTWHVPRDEHVHLTSIHAKVDDVIEVPYVGPAVDDPRTAISLLELRGNTFVKDRFDTLSWANGMLEIRGLPPGDYDLWMKHGDQRFQIRVADAEVRGDYLLGTSRQLELRGRLPLHIATVKPETDGIAIQLLNTSKATRVHVFATRYQPAYAAFHQLGRIRDVEPLRWMRRRIDSLYAEGRDIGDELRYIIDRQLAVKFPGNMLDRPNLLLNPWAIRKTETGLQRAAAGEAFDVQPESAPASDREQDVPSDVQRAPATDFSNLDFLLDASALHLNLTPDAEGRIVLKREELGPHQQIHIVASDTYTTVYRSLALPEVRTHPLDLRLAHALDLAGKFTQQKRTTFVPAGEPFTIPDIASSRYEIYDSLARVYRLFLTLSNDKNLAEFGFLLNWTNMEDAEKRAKYSKYACHELHYFLARKDPDFFDRVVKPYLRNKQHKTFLDELFVDSDLHAYLRPWNHGQLNIVERVLLGQAIPSERPRARRHVEDLFHLIPPDIDEFNRLFDTAILGRSLDTDLDLNGLGNASRLGAMGGFGANSRGRTQEQLMFRQYAKRAEAGAAAPSPATESPRLQLGQDAAESRDKENESLRERYSQMKSELQDRLDVDAGRRMQVRQLFRQLDKTQEWVENNYYQLPIQQQNADLVRVNAFWNDFAAQVPQQPFFSASFPEASHNFTEMMLALAVLDLPFEPHEHTIEIKDGQLILTPGSAVIVFHEQIRRTQDVAEQSPILVSQNFYRHGDRYEQVNNEQRDKFVTDEFLLYTVYGCQVVVTNPSSAPQKLDLLLQVPVGAVPVMNGRYTRSVHIDLQPFNTRTVDYHFYFPVTGTFEHYPVHVAKNEQLLASASAVRLNVVAEPSQIDRESWDYISQFASHDDVLSYLRQHNIHRLNLDKIAFRIADKEFFESVIQLLEERHVYSNTLWSYGIHHDAPDIIREFLQHQDQFVSQCGAFIESPLLTIDPQVRKSYQHMEYSPLVNARVHRLGHRRQILNDRFHQQYHQLLNVLCYRRELSDDDRMSVTYYLLLQDRIQEALHQFQQVNGDRLATRLQHDYFTAYLDFFVDNLERARRIADNYADFPVDRWRVLFANMRSHLDEIQGGGPRVSDPDDRTQQQTQLASTEPAFDFHVEAKRVNIDYQNLSSVLVNFYLMDIELLFSRNPFVQNHSQQFSHIRPNESLAIELPEGASKYDFELPADLHNRNVLVEIVGAGQTKAQAYFSNSLTVQTVEAYGQLQVRHAATGQAIPRVYVKVYARMQDGTVRFFKDGYTDLRGRFDYASLSTNEIDNVERLSILMLSEKHGAVVREVNPPRR